MTENLQVGCFARKNMMDESGDFQGVFGKTCCQNVVFWWLICGAMCGKRGVLDGGFWWHKHGTGF
jgi:hypothetical protein